MELSATEQRCRGTNAPRQQDKVWNSSDKDDRWTSSGDVKSLDGVISWESRPDSKRRVGMKDRYIQYLLMSYGLKLAPKTLHGVTCVPLSTSHGSICVGRHDAY